MTAAEPALADRSWEELLHDAVTTLTAAARLTVPIPDRHHHDSSPAGQPAAETSKPGQVDWADFVAQALAGAAANTGGIEQALAGRPGSWEADSVRNLLTSTVGADESHLLEHRTEPLSVHLPVEQILTDAGAWEPYDQAQQELAGRYDASSAATSAPTEAADVDTGQDRHADELAELEERLEQQRQQDWARYGQALKANVEAIASRLEGLRVPVTVTLELDGPPPADDRDPGNGGVVERLLEQAIAVTPLFGDGRPPLERLA